MATKVRGEEPSLERTLLEEPYRFDFFQAVRLLQERLPTGSIAVGREGPPASEAVRFLARLGLSFPASSIHRIEPPDRDDGPAAMTVNFLGLTGPSGVLPHVYTELLRGRARAGESAVASFLDLINHRLVSLFYRAWEKHRVVLDAGRSNGSGFAGHVFALMGLGLPSHRERSTLSDRVLLKYAGCFAQQRRPAIVLEEILREHTELPVEVVQFAGRWLALAPPDRSTLGGRAGQNALGVSLVLGTKVWDAAGRILIRLGPLSYREFRDHLPDGPGFRSMAELARLYVGAEFDLAFQLVLGAAEVPRCRLSSRPHASARLGRDAWLSSRPPASDANDAIFPVNL